MGKTKELLQPNPSEYTNSPCPCNQPSICTHGKDYIIVVLCVFSSNVLCIIKAWGGYNKGLGWDLCTYLFAPKVLSDCILQIFTKRNCHNLHFSAYHFAINLRMTPVISALINCLQLVV